MIRHLLQTKKEKSIFYLFFKMSIYYQPICFGDTYPTFTAYDGLESSSTVGTRQTFSEQHTTQCACTMPTAEKTAQRLHHLLLVARNIQLVLVRLLSPDGFFFFLLLLSGTYSFVLGSLLVIQHHLNLICVFVGNRSTELQWRRIVGVQICWMKSWH